LAVPRRNGEIEVWERSNIALGQEPEKEMRSKLECADMALFLITKDTISSESSYQEMLLAISILQRRHKPVYRIKMRSFNYQRSFLDPIPVLPQENFPPIIEHTYPDKAFSEVVAKIRSITRSIAAGKFSFDTVSHPVPPMTTSQEVEPKPMLLGFALDMSSSAIANFRPGLSKENERNAIKLLTEAAKSVHMTRESDPDLLNRLQTSLFLYAFGLKLRPIIDVYTCMNIAQRLITPEIIEPYKKKSESPLANLINSFSGALPIDQRRIFRKFGENYVESLVAKKILEDHAERIMTTAEQSHMMTPTLEDFWDQLEVHAGMRLYHAEHLVGGKKPSLATLFYPIIRRFRQEVNQIEEKPNTFFFFLSDGEFSSYQFAPFKQQLEELGVKIVSCYLSKRAFTNNYRILHGTAKDQWSEEAQELWKFASLADMPEKGLSTLTSRGWHIEEDARLFLQINHSTMLTDFLAVILQERQR
ncbi:MAG: hypothetical protein ACRDF4_02180, partial [Rhabdochlamydiaceae bacterium]